MKPVLDRSCGDCSLCCKVMAVSEIDKPKGVWCGHFVRGTGCGVYSNRPEACRTFICQWLVNGQMGPEWKPNTCKMVVVGEGAKKLVVHVDAGSPGPWREPYLGWLREVAARGLKQGGMVLVIEKGQTIVVLPDRGVALGTVGPDEKIVLAEIAGTGKWDAMVMKKDEADEFSARVAHDTQAKVTGAKPDGFR